MAQLIATPISSPFVYNGLAKLSNNKSSILGGKICGSPSRLHSTGLVNTLSDLKSDSKFPVVNANRKRFIFICRDSKSEAPVFVETAKEILHSDDGDRSESLKWYSISDNILVGNSPQSAADLVAIATEAGANALLCLLTEEEWESPKINWNALKMRPGLQEVVVARLSMKDNDPVDQGLALPEAVRALGSLIAGGRKVYINCTAATTRSSLVALGYLTFVQANEFNRALGMLKDKFPEANPSVDSWEEAKAKLLAGELKRVTELAHKVYKNRSANGIAGTPADDWLEAQRLLIAELFARRVSTDVILSSALAQVAILKSKEDTAVELVELKARASGAKAAADSADSRIKELLAQLSTLSTKESASSDSLASANEQIGLLTKQIEELLSQQASLKREVKSKGSLANEENGALALRIAQLETSLIEAKKTVDEASNYNTLLSKQIGDLEKQITESKKGLSLANEKVSLLSQQLEEANRKEASSNEELKLARAKLDMLSNQVFDLEKRESLTLQELVSSGQRITALSSELDQLKLLLEKSKFVSEELKQKAELLTNQLSTLKANESSSKIFIVELKKKIEILESEKLAFPKQDAEKDKSYALKIAKLQSEIEDLKAQLAAAKSREEEKAIQTNSKFSELQKEIANFRNELLAAEKESVHKENESNEKVGQLEKLIIVLKGEVALAKIKEEDLLLQLSAVAGKPEALAELEKTVVILKAENSKFADALKQAEGRASEASSKSNSLSIELTKAQDSISQLTLKLEQASKIAAKEKSKRENELEAEVSALKKKLLANQQKPSADPSLLEQISILRKSLVASLVLAIALPIAVYAFLSGNPGADQTGTLEERVQAQLQLNSSLEKQVETLSSQNALLKSSVESLESANKVKAEEVRELQGGYESSNRRIGDLEAENGRVSSKLLVITGDLAREKKEVVAVRSLLEEKTSAINKFTTLLSPPVESSSESSVEELVSFCGSLSPPVKSDFGKVCTVDSMGSASFSDSDILRKYKARILID